MTAESRKTTFVLERRLLVIGVLAAWSVLRPPSVDGASPDAPEVSFHGSFRSYATAWHQAAVLPGEVDKTDARASTPLRLRLRARSSRRLALEIAYEITPSVEPATALQSPLPVPDPFAYRLWRNDPYVLSVENTRGNFQIVQNWDRAVMTYSPDWGDVMLGRQAVAFGSARVINPLDVLNPFTYAAIDTETRTGVDAWRVRLPIGFMGEIDAGFVAGREGRWEQSAAFVKPRGYVWKTNVTGLVMALRGHVLVGLDLVRAVGGASVWLESGYLLAGVVGLERESGQDYLRLSAGADYQLAESLYGFAEYHYSGAGAGRPEEYLARLDRAAFQDGAVFLMGRHYLAPGLEYQLTALVTVSGQALWNLEDGSAVLAPGVSVSISDNAVLESGAFVGLGREPVPAPLFGPPRPVPLEARSEFGLYPDIYYAAAKLYF